MKSVHRRQSSKISQLIIQHWAYDSWSKSSLLLPHNFLDPIGSLKIGMGIQQIPNLHFFLMSHTKI